MAGLTSSLFLLPSEWKALPDTSGNVWLGLKCPPSTTTGLPGGLGDTVKDLTNVLYMEHKRPETDIMIFSGIFSESKRSKPET